MTWTNSGKVREVVLGSVLQKLLIPFCYIPLGIISNRGGGRGKNSYDGGNGTQEAVSSPFSGDGL